MSQSKLNGFLKTAESLKIRGLANAEKYPEGSPVNQDSCVPPRKRKCNFTFDDSPREVDQRGYEQATQRTPDEPTDLSMPRLDPCSSFIQHVAQSSSSCQYDTLLPQVSSKISVKPNEVLLPSPAPEVVDVSEELVPPVQVSHSHQSQP